MPKFVANIRDNSGTAKTIFVEAENRNAAVVNIQRQGVLLFSLTESDAVKPVSHADTANRVRRFTHNGVSLEDISVFSKQLATMLEAGVPLLRSITVIAEQVESRDFSSILDKVRADVESGQSFSKSLARHPKYFGQFWVSLVEVGEAAGTMPQVLKKLTEYMEEAAKFRAQIIGAMIYPGILLTVACMAVMAFALFIGPTFEKIFKDMNIPLPGITVVMLTIFSILRTKLYLIIILIVVAVFVFKNYVKTPVGRRQFETLIFALPIVGPIAKLVVIEKFTSQMAILIDSGVPILYALEISEKLVDNLVCGEVISGVRDAVREGQLLAEPMEKSGFFPPMTVQMIRVGEETGELGKMLNHVANYYKSVVEEFMRRIGTLIEPVMLVFMGGIVGAIVISMFVPLLSLSTGG
ncbi:MAG: type II secretion system F family protein [Candidatus Omnitrophica bacterium]|nr:type II secretion system F family protein [Candidatus Omnitrophota bacterium]